MGHHLPKVLIFKNIFYRIQYVLIVFFIFVVSHVWNAFCAFVISFLNHINICKMLADMIVHEITIIYQVTTMGTI